MAPLHKLMEKHLKWVWSAECHNAFLKCKELLTCEEVQAHYDSAKPIKLACDASAYGLGQCSYIPWMMVKTLWHLLHAD